MQYIDLNLQIIFQIVISSIREDIQCWKSYILRVWTVWRKYWFHWFLIVQWQCCSESPLDSTAYWILRLHCCSGIPPHRNSWLQLNCNFLQFDCNRNWKFELQPEDLVEIHYSSAVESSKEMHWEDSVKRCQVAIHHTGQYSVSALLFLNCLN